MFIKVLGIPRVVPPIVCSDDAVGRTPNSRAPSAGRRQRVLTLLPLALLSSAVTVHLAAPGPGAVSAAPSAPATSDPATPYLGSPPMTPASVSTQLADEASTTGVVTTVATADVQGIPAPALAAYQRAETVINAADGSCNLGWQLLAAIGDVESHHGQFGVSRLDSEGVATPSIIGLPLNGVGNVALIKDTDAGVLDGDQVFDRAVGPMQFIPSTWSVVGVDSDNDGERNPQDIDDAALAAAVYLCSGDDDLSTASGQVVAVNRYNHSAAYVERVLSLMQQYLAGGYATGPSGSLPPVTVSTVAAGRIDGLHPDPSGDDSGSVTPTPPPPNPNWTGHAGGNNGPRDPGTDPVDPPTDPGTPPPPPPPPPPVVAVIDVPPAPGVLDECGTDNATWLVPAATKGLAWTATGRRISVTITDNSTFPGDAKSYDYGTALDSGVACPVYIPTDPGDPNWPLQPGGGGPWAPGKPEQQWSLSLPDAQARCADEGFVAGDGTLGYDTCLAYYVAPGTPAGTVVR